MLRESPDTIGLLESALALHSMSLCLVPLTGKRAIVKNWPALRLDASDIRSWSRRGVNWGILTGEPLVVLDTDSDAAEAWVRGKGIESPVMVRSGRGGLHRYFRCPMGLQIRSRSGVHRIAGLDVRGWHGYIVAAGSLHPETRRRYHYLPGRELHALDALPEFDLAWVQGIRAEPFLKPQNRDESQRGVGGRIRDVRAYIRGIRSIEGSGGDRACFTVACLLAEAGFGFAEALAEIGAWNRSNAAPPWQTKELERKLRYAYARVTGGT
jgi:hypothetical protein